MNLKEKIRQKMNQMRRQMPEAVRQKKGLIIQQKLEKNPLFQQAKTVMLYYAFSDEVETQYILKKYQTMKHLLLPRIRKQQIEAISYHGEDYLQVGYAKIPEPIEVGPIDGNDKIDLIIVPGVAFDPKGTRLGFGKGFYDHFLKRKKTIYKISLAFQEQVVDYIPRHTYDSPVDVIITDQKTYWCNKKLHRQHALLQND